MSGTTQGAGPRPVSHGGTVFADPTGRRWQRIRRVGGGAAVVMIAVTALFMTLAYQPPRGTGKPAAALSVRDTGRHAPVIGAGPLTRVLRIEQAGASVRGIEPFTGQAVVELDESERNRIGDARYVIQRYGYSETARRTIQLTFDDGPDPEVTRQLLDLLSREKVPATFFVVGRVAVQQPDLIQRMIREGHAVGIHTLTHSDIASLPDWREQAELVETERVLRSVAGVGATFWRMPYDDPTDESAARTIDGLLRAQRLGYVHASYDFDTRDWVHDENPDGRASDIPVPDLASGRNVTMLMHDAGGPNRERTVAYVAGLITQARAAGYTFHTMPQVSPDIRDGNPPVVEPTLGDRAAFVMAKAAFEWPSLLMTGLFAMAVVLVLVVGLGSTVVAVVRARRRRRVRWSSLAGTDLKVTAVLAAFNEETVIERTLQTLLASEHPLHEVIVVDDGSSDSTAAKVRRVALRDPRVRLVQQVNQGKATALNHALLSATGHVVVTLDADTVVTPQTVTNLVRHFAADPDGRLGGVAGVVRVGNRTRNLLTRWQALEYLTQIGIERSAQDAFGAISIVPGACAAWRREAILEVGGYASDTLAEDCDLALSLHAAGWRVTQDDEALAFTEAPETVDDLLKQRKRWTFGTMQAMAKHRGLMFRRGCGVLGWYVLPNYVVSVIVPLLTLPFVALMAFVTVQQGGLPTLAVYFGLFLALHMMVAMVAVRLMGESWTHVLVVPLYRLVYEPLRAYLLYSCAIAAVKGTRMGWNKLDRTGSVDVAALTGHEGVRDHPGTGHDAEPAMLPAPAQGRLVDAPEAPQRQAA